MIPATIKPKGAKGFQMALFGATTLLGKALRESLERRSFPARSLRLFDRAEREGTLAEFQGEAMVVTSPDPDLLDNVDIAFLCGSSEDSRSYLDWPAEKQFVAIDLSKASTGNPAIPVIHYRLNRSRIHLRERIIASPSPVSQALSTVLSPLQKALGIRSAVVTVFPPVSDRGEEGIDELFRQTVNILNFQEVPKEIFNRQLAFNLIPHFSPAGVSEEADPRAAIARETVKILEADFPMQVGVVQAPVFHCHSLLLWVQFGKSGTGAEIRRLLDRQADLTVPDPGGEAATPAELTGKEQILVQPLDSFPGRTDSCWLWMVSDSLRAGAALNAVRIAEVLIGRGEK